LQARGSILPIFEKQNLKKLYDLVWGNRILKSASKVLALTPTESKYYIKMGADSNKIEIIPNGISLSDYINMPKRGEFRKAYDICDNEKIILFLGRIHKIKGIGLLVDSFAELLRERNDIRLVVAGPDGGFLSELIKQIDRLNISDKVIFPGPLYRTEKLQAYIDADVYVLPSVFEAFPNTVLEAFACGTPVIVTNSCGITDIIKNSAIVVEYNKLDLMEAIDKVLNDNNLVHCLKSNSNLLINTKFNWEKIIENLESLYYSII